MDCRIPGFPVLHYFLVLVAQLCLTLCDTLEYIKSTKLLCPWNSLGKNTGVGCHFLLQLFPRVSSNSSVESVMTSDNLTVCYSLLLLPSIFPSIRVFSNESAPCMKWPKYGSSSFIISSSNEYSELISFRYWRYKQTLLAVRSSGDTENK